MSYVKKKIKIYEFITNRRITIKNVEQIHKIKENEQY